MNSSLLARLALLSVVMTFSVTCLAQSGHTWWSTALSESFESGFTPGHNLNGISSWAVTQPASDTSMFWRQAGYVHPQNGPSRAANIHWNSSPAEDTNAYTVRLSTPLLSSGTNGTELYFDYWLDLFTTGQTHALKVYITFNNWSTSTLVGTISSTSSVGRTTYFVDLAAAGATGSATYKIGFQAEGYDSGLYLNGFWLDDVTVLTGSNGSPSSDAYESNNTVATATTISLPFSNPDPTITAGDNDYWTFDTAGGGLIEIDIDASGQLAAELYRKVGSTLLLAARNPSFTSAVTLKAAFPDAETWVLRICGVASTTTGGYELTIALNTTVNDGYEPNNTDTTAFDLGGSAVWDVYTSYVEEGDVDHYTFAGIGAEVTIYDLLYSFGGQTLRASLFTGSSSTGPWTLVATTDLVEGVHTSAVLSCATDTQYLVKIEKPFATSGETDTYIGYSLASLDWSSATNSSSVVLDSEAPQNVRVGETVGFQLEATPSNANHALRYSAVSPPSGLSINAVTGVVTWVPGEAHRGLNNLEFEVHNWGDDHDASTSDDSTDNVFVQVTVESLFEVVPEQRSSTLQDPIGGAMTTGEGVSVATGEYSHGISLFSIPGRMLPLSLSLSYRSNLRWDGPLGYGWTSPAFQFMWYDDGSDTVYQFDGAGRFDSYTLNSGGTVGEGPYVRTGYSLEVWRDDATTSDNVSDDTLMIKWPDGSTLSFSATNADANGNILFRPFISSDRYGNMVIYLHDSVTGQLEEIRGDLYDSGDPDNHRILLEYDYLGRLSKVTDFADYSAHSAVLSSYLGEREWDFQYDVDGNLVEIALPKTARYYSDTKGANFRTRIGFSYDGDHRMLGAFDARQMNETSPLPWLLNEYDTNHKVVRQDVGRVDGSDTTKARTIHYASSTLVHYIDALGHMSSYVLNSDRRVTNLQHHTGTWSNPSTQASAKLRSTDLDTYQTTFEYDAEFNVSKSTGPAGDEVHRLYDVSNASRLKRSNLLRTLVLPSPSMAGPLPSEQEHGLLSVMTYLSPVNGAHNLVETVVSPEAFEVPSGWVITDSLPTPNEISSYSVTYEYNTSSTTYGALGTLRKVILPAIASSLSPHTLNSSQTSVTEFEHNSLGQLISTTDPEGIETAMTYGTTGTAKGRVQSISAGAQTSAPITSSLTYNRLGAVIETTDPMSKVSKVFLNQLDQVVRSETPTLASISTNYWSTAEYDLNGNTEVSNYSNIDETGATGKDGYGNTVAAISTAYVYNQMDMPIEVRHAAGITAQTTISTFYYDNMFRAVGRKLPEGNMDGADLDELGRAIKTYWGFDNVNIMKDSALVKAETHYDIASNVMKVVDGLGKEHETEYDGYHRPTKSFGPDTGASHQFLTTMEYDRASRIVRRQGWSDTGSGAVAYAESKSFYDNWGRITAAMTKAVDSTGTGLGYSSLETSTNYESGWSTARFKYRSNGQISELVDDLGYKRFMYYDDYGRHYRTKDDLDPTGTYSNEDILGFDANSRVTSTTAKYIDQSNSTTPIRTIVANFVYDELGRKVKSISPELETSVTRHEQTWHYDSRSNVVKAIDRMGTVHRAVFDAHSRPLSTFTDGVTFRNINTSTKVVSTSSANIEESRTYYDKNSNVTKIVDAGGNTTEFRRDMAHRWLQTLLPDPNPSTDPNSTTAGSGHSVSQVGSTNFYSKSGAYDANSQLLARTDPNGTVVSYTYDSYGRLLAEDADTSAATTAGFPIVGEDSATYEYDAAGRLYRAKTKTGGSENTRVTSIWNSLGKLEHQTSTITDPITNNPHYTSVKSSWDESGRRYARQLDYHDITTSWKFDRLHRPINTRVSQPLSGGGDRFGSLTDNIIEEFKYLGGGFMHVEQKRYAPEDPSNYVLSKFEHDNWMRLVKVRHSVTDVSTSTTDKLVTAWESRYNANNMMVYEGYWYGADDGAAADSPTGVNLFYHDERNLLVKAIYNAKVDGLQHGSVSQASALSTIASVGASNNLEHTDRQVYDIRNTGGRRAVNWYRALETPTSMADSSNPADQMTSYVTGETEANGASITEKDVGEGERGEYKSVGLPNPNYSYDNNKNVTADPTRTFTYNYRNQMRSAARKSDNGTLVEYMHDAGGREVWNRRHWYVGRHETLDTRFPLDVNLDEDANTTYMELTDGGIANFDPYSTSFTLEESSWPGLLGDFNGGAELHYFDFQVYIPGDIEGLPDNYIGYVSYEDVAVHFFTDKTVLTMDRHDYSPSAIGYQYGTALSAGWHNVGIWLRGAAFGLGVQVWADGNDIFTSSYGAALPNAKAYFGSNRVDFAHYSMAVHAFASYRTNYFDVETGGIKPTTNVTGRDRGNPSSIDSDAVTMYTMEPSFLLAGSNATVLAMGFDGTLKIRHSLPNTRQINAAWTSPQVDNGSSGFELGLILVNLASENGAPNLYRPQMTSATTVSGGFSFPWDVGSETGPIGDCIGPGNYSEHGMHLAVIVNGIGDAREFGGQDFSDLFQATVRGKGGELDALASGAVEGYGSCECRMNDVSETYIDEGQLGQSGDEIETDGGKIGDTETEVMFNPGKETPKLELEKYTGRMVDEAGRDVDPGMVTKYSEVFWETSDSTGKKFRQKVKDPTKQGPNKDNPKESLIELGTNVSTELVPVKEDCGEYKSILDKVSTALDWLGFLPGIGSMFDLANAVVSLARGDFAGAAMNALSAIPGIGDAVALTKAVAGAASAAAALKVVTGAFSDAAKSAAAETCGSGLKEALEKAAKKAGSMSDDEIANMAKTFCFVAGTEVHTDTGTTVIEEVSEGDYVWSWDAWSREWTLSVVEETYVRRYAGELVEVQLGEGSLRATPEHPFWVATGVGLARRPESAALGRREREGTASGRWVEARNLRAGDVLGSRHSAGSVTVRGVRTCTAECWVYNFSVRGTDTYSVGAMGALVHNTKCKGTRVKPEGNVHDHHLLPQDLADEFKKRGITDIEDDHLKVYLPPELHTMKPNGVHTGPYEESWNGVWEGWLKDNKNATKEDVLLQMNKMMKDFGIDDHYRKQFAKPAVDATK